jgi:hypothetical protein
MLPKHTTLAKHVICAGNLSSRSSDREARQWRRQTNAKLFQFPGIGNLLGCADATPLYLSGANFVLHRFVPIAGNRDEFEFV